MLLQKIRTGANGRVDSVAIMRKEVPLRALVQFYNHSRIKPLVKRNIPANIGYVAVTDTALLNQYLNLDFVKNKFPANLQFVYGKPENATDDATSKNFVVLYAVKTLDNGTAALEGEHVSDARA